MDTNKCRYEIGFEFRPSFRSIVHHFEVRGYDAEKDMVLTIVYPKEGSPFDDSIEQAYLDGALETGDYIPMGNPKSLKEAVENRIGLSTFPEDNTVHVLTNPYAWLDTPKPRYSDVFTGPCCGRCIHRKGRTSNREWCKSHCNSDKCYRFKLEQ